MEIRLYFGPTSFLAKLATRPPKVSFAQPLATVFPPSEPSSSTSPKPSESSQQDLFPSPTHTMPPSSPPKITSPIIPLELSITALAAQAMVPSTAQQSPNSLPEQPRPTLETQVTGLMEKDCWLHIIFMQLTEKDS